VDRVDNIFHRGKGDLERGRLFCAKKARKMKKVIDLCAIKYIYELNLFCRHEDHQFHRKSFQGQPSIIANPSSNAVVANTKVDP